MCKKYFFPFSKLVIRDLAWLKEVGLFDRLKKRKKAILGICGGYEMMFKRLFDPHHIESNQTITKGLGFIDDDITFQKEKIVKKGVYNIFGKNIRGFEIHHGVSKKYPLYYQKDNIKGTFVHGIFDNAKFREYKKKSVDEFIKIMRNRWDINMIVGCL